MKKILILTLLYSTHSSYTMLTPHTLGRIAKQKSTHRFCQTHPSLPKQLNALPESLAMQKIFETVLAVYSPHNLKSKIGLIEEQLKRSDLSANNKQTLEILNALLHKKSTTTFCEQQDTLIHYATKKNNPLLLQAALKYGLHGSVDLYDHNNNTPLFYAAQHGLLGIARILIQHKANPNSINQKGQTPLHAVVTSPVINMDPAKNDELLYTLALLKKAGADSNIQDQHYSTPERYIDEALNVLEASRGQSIYNETDDLIFIYHHMRQILHFPMTYTE